MVAIAVVMLLAQSAGVENFPGDYQLVPAESDNVNQAIERVVAKMSFLTRGPARTRIAAKCIAYPAIHVTKEAGGFRIRLEQGSNVVLTPGGAAAAWKTPEGDTVAIRLDPDFRQVIESKDGQRENHFSRKGDRLVVDSKLTSERLPAPVVFKLVYRRQ